MRETGQEREEGTVRKTVRKIEKDRVKARKKRGVKDRKCKKREREREEKLE